MKLTDKAYDILKWACLILSPALITLVTALGAIYGTENIEMITGTIAAVTTFLGALIGISQANYNGGYYDE